MDKSDLAITAAIWIVVGSGILTGLYFLLSTSPEAAFLLH